MDAGIGVNEHAFCSDTLRALTGDGVAVVEMTMLAGTKFDLAITVDAGGEPGTGMDSLDGGEVTIGNAKRFVRRSELNAVANGEFPFNLPINADACEAAGIVGDMFLVRFFDREQVCRWVDGDDRSIGGGFNSNGLAAACVAHNVVDLVVACP